MRTTLSPSKTPQSSQFKHITKSVDEVTRTQKSRNPSWSQPIAKTNKLRTPAFCVRTMQESLNTRYKSTNTAEAERQKAIRRPSVTAATPTQGLPHSSNSAWRPIPQGVHPRLTAPAPLPVLEMRGTHHTLKSQAQGQGNAPAGRSQGTQLTAHTTWGREGKGATEPSQKPGSTRQPPPLFWSNCSTYPVPLPPCPEPRENAAERHLLLTTCKFILRLSQPSPLCPSMSAL